MEVYGGIWSYMEVYGSRGQFITKAFTIDATIPRTPNLNIWISENQQIHKKSFLQSWYTHSWISCDHASNQKSNISPGGGHTAELAKLHQSGFTLWTPTWDTKVGISRAVGCLQKWEFDTMVLSMSRRARYTQNAPKLIKIRGSKGLRAGP